MEYYVDSETCLFGIPIKVEHMILNKTATVYGISKAKDKRWHFIDGTSNPIDWMPNFVRFKDAISYWKGVCFMRISSSETQEFNLVEEMINETIEDFKMGVIDERQANEALTELGMDADSIGSALYSK